jgi:arylsulfatase A-like enzyme
MLENRGAQTYVEAGYDESDKTTDAILKLLKEKHPSFLAAIYGATDHAGHRFGPRSDEVRDAVLGIDTAVARLTKGLKELGLYEQTVIAFTADHGMSGYDEKPISADPTKALEKAGFKVATSSKAVNDDTQIIMISAGVRMIWFRKNVSETQKATALNCLREIKGTELLERAQLDALGCHNNRSGDVILSPLAGYTISHAGDKGGQHGRFAERNPVMFFHGPGFAHGKTLACACNIDVVPTLLHLAGVPPADTVEGKVIYEALAP